MDRRNIYVEEASAARKTMEDEIREAVSVAVQRFEEATGMCPNAIAVCMVDSTRIGDAHQRFVVGGVRAEVFL